MRPILMSSQKAAAALRKAERALRNWQDDADSPRADVDKMLLIVADLREWVQGHVLADIEHAQDARRASASSAVAEAGEMYEADEYESNTKLHEADALLRGEETEDSSDHAPRDRE